MTIVEQRNLYPSYVWARDIKVTIGEQGLEVSGRKPLCDEDAESAPDLLRSYRQDIARFRQGRATKSRHWQFANAQTRTAQIDFVRKFGPVVVTTSKTADREGPPDFFDLPTTERIVEAHQDLGELEREQQLYRSAFVLITELRKRNKASLQTLREMVSTIVENSRWWTEQWERERRLRSAGEGYLQKPDWFFGPKNIECLETWQYFTMQEPSSCGLVGVEPIHAAHLIICELVNAFAPTVQLWGDTPIESPDTDLSGGIRPILYFILRREYLGGGGVEICRNADCRAIFEIDRSGKQFCSEVCSRQQRQREYWQHKGKKLRARRLRGIRKRK